MDSRSCVVIRLPFVMRAEVSYISLFDRGLFHSIAFLLDVHKRNTSRHFAFIHFSRNYTDVIILLRFTELLFIMDAMLPADPTAKVISLR